MFSDTHFHFNILREEETSRVDVLKSLLARNTFFGQDIGTHCDDLASRQKLMEDTISILPQEDQSKAKNMIWFSTGIWPAPEAINERHKQIKILEQELINALNSPDPFHKKIAALGEFGLDHHWNPSGADGRCESDFDQEMFDGEQELFVMQLKLAEKYKLPAIIHSRDAAQQTYRIIKDTGYHNGIIHCYSYGLEEAKWFLDLGWYISFSGAVTYTKKSKMDAMTELLNYIPKDRILLETDAPYLAPVPHRGKSNTPVLVEHTYDFVASARNTTATELSDLVDQNIKNLFKL
ncbi:MAG: TatD family hydrolase [Treponema sp.]|nr:TatD family hydrolase [Treponema sp.]